MKTAAAFVLAAANLVAGHATFQSFVIGGKDQGQHFAIQTPANGNNPITDVTSTAMVCNGGKAVTDRVEVASGSSLTFQWHHNDPATVSGDNDEPIAASHKGPVMVYIAPAASNGEGAVWTKIYEDGYTGGKWAVDKFIANKGAITIDLPNLAAGDYIIRPEIIALHEGNRPNGAQFYNGCGNIKVTGSGTATLPSTGVDMTKAYKATDPGVLCNIYSGLTSYEIPGPKVWDGASSGTAPAPTTPSKTAAPVSSSAPSQTATPTVIASPSATPIKEAEPATPTESQAAPAPSSGSGSTLPETFTIEQFISWLKTTTSTRNARRAHPRAFQL
ncbi:lytic polysaccharide monooxygenase [Cucurbitaria berberidis CBS 394.84]|uniref:AA9 family lytic polysaccharide monooxygenase n=1 Tax=Cucurbitaria berberidis CBS 394.84 TaxID=1168544 RepID=A0A9P4GPL6_9PLEO|nr:lytic polysaccharide monooxygenase [Cucurbitaria berberidis CBS 394.84]KAF1848875.1 lytic polysaccharide monooxygenase [Cucurbitaria berberidis CBS 394.84]